MYLPTVDLPSFTVTQRAPLEGPIDLEEIQEAVGSFPSCKAPGQDGIPIKVYTVFPRK